MNRAKKLADVGSTTALSALVEIVAEKRPDSAILSRQMKAVLARFKSPEDRGAVIEGFCDELQALIESVPEIRNALQGSARLGRP